MDKSWFTVIYSAREVEATIHDNFVTHIEAKTPEEAQTQVIERARAGGDRRFHPLVTLHGRVELCEAGAKRWFTVVLFYPDYMNTEHETYVHAAEAGSLDEAVAEARRMACEANEMSVEDGLDFVCLMVFAGRSEML